MKIIITGAHGQLGFDLINNLQETNELLPVGRDMDVCDFSKVKEKFSFFKPDAVIHAAAFTDVDGCEEDEKKAFLVNASGTQNVSLAAREYGSLMIYFSTDYVFDGQKGKPYHEYDQPNPLNVYGLSKLAGEEIVKNTIRNHFIIRTSWLHGLEGKNFLKSIIQKAKEGETLKVVDDQVGSPTFTNDLAKIVGEFLKVERYGIYHVVNEGCTSWYNLAKEALELYGLNDIEINSTDTESLSRPATRPKYSVLENFSLRQLGISMRNYQSALNEFVTGLKNAEEG